MAARYDTNFGNERALAKYMIVVPLFDLEFLDEFAA
jgi:hypothetical protein